MNYTKLAIFVSLLLLLYIAYKVHVIADQTKFSYVIDGEDSWMILNSNGEGCLVDNDARISDGSFFKSFVGCLEGRQSGNAIIQ